MNITNSPDISVLLLNCTFDVSGTNPVVSLANLSQGNHLNNINWWFVVTSPTQTIIHQGTQASPDITGTWTTFSLTDSWPRPFNQLEWSGSPYNLTVYIVD